MTQSNDETNTHDQVKSWLNSGVAVPEVERRLSERGVDPQEASRMVDAALLVQLSKQSKRGSPRRWVGWSALGMLAMAVMFIARFIPLGGNVNPALPLGLPVVNPHKGLPPLEDSLRLLNDPLPDVRKSAAKMILKEARSGLGFRSVPLKALPGLVDAAEDSDEEVRLAAIRCLAQIGPEAVPALLDALRQQQAKVVLWPCAVFGLDSFGQVAVAVVKNPVMTRRREACVSIGSALGKIGEPALPHLIEGLRDPNSSVRLGAVLGLTVLGPKAKDAMPSLLGLFGDRDPQVQAGAALALAHIGQPAVPALAAKLKDNDAQVRVLAATALTRVGATYSTQILAGITNVEERARLQKMMQGKRAEAKKEALAALIAALKDSSVEVRLLAAEALMDFPEVRPSFTSTLKELLKSSNRDVSRRAAELLKEIDSGIAN